MDNRGEIIMYQTADGLTKIEARLRDETVWLTQAQMAVLFQRDISVVSRHIKNLFSEGEVDEKSNLHFLQIANSDKPTAFYSLNVIISPKLEDGSVAKKTPLMVMLTVSGGKLTSVSWLKIQLLQNLQ